MTLQETLTKLYTPFLELECEVTHYRRGQTNRFVVWAEDGEDVSFNADNHKREQQLTGLVDFYTKAEFDTIADDIQAIFDAEGVGWNLQSVQYEEETNLIHYQWRWWVI